MSGDEFLRGVMTKQCRVRRQKFYTIDIDVAAAPAVGATFSGNIQFNKDTYFLLTSIAVSEAFNLTGVGPITANNAASDFTYLFTVQKTGRQISNIGMRGGIEINNCLNQAVDMESYILFTGNEILSVIAANRSAGIGSCHLFITLTGVEYLI